MSWTTFRRRNRQRASEPPAIMLSCSRGDVEAIELRQHSLPLDTLAWCNLHPRVFHRKVDVMMQLAPEFCCLTLMV